MNPVSRLSMDPSVNVENSQQNNITGKDHLLKPVDESLLISQVVIPIFMGLGAVLVGLVSAITFTAGFASAGIVLGVMSIALMVLAISKATGGVSTIRRHPGFIVVNNRPNRQVNVPFRRRDVRNNLRRQRSNQPVVTGLQRGHSRRAI